MIHYLISIDEKVVLAYWIMPVTEIDSRLLWLFLKVNLSTIIIYVFISCTEWILIKFCQLRLNLIVYLFLQFFTWEGIISIFHIPISDSHIFSKFTCKFLWLCTNYYFSNTNYRKNGLKDVQLHQQQKVDLTLQFYFPKILSNTENITCWRWRDKNYIRPAMSRFFFTNCHKYRNSTNT